MRKYIYDIYRLIKFCLRLYSLRVFSLNNPLTLLIVLKEYLLSESPLYSPKDRITYRTHEQNAKLLGTLVETYTVTKSKTELNQILEVIRATVAIGGKNNGRRI